MEFATSKDGTKLAYDKAGSGPALLLVDGAFGRRAFGPNGALAKVLASQFTTYHFDRRSRGDSGDTKPYSPERELEDVAAIAAKAGEPVFLYGISSGAALAMRAAASGLFPVRKLAFYEPPFRVDGAAAADPPDFRERIAKFLANDERDEAVKLFMRVVGVPAFVLFILRRTGVWPKLREVAHTLPYDFAQLGETQSSQPFPPEWQQTLRSIHVPTLAIVGGKAAPWMVQSVKRVSETIPGARQELLPGQMHQVSEKAIAPLLESFFR